MKIQFSKMHGAGNDFIVVDDRDGSFPIEDRAFLMRISARATGVGCDGFLLVQESECADFRMRFVNPDGGEVEMCGNGARCIARFAFERGIASAAMAFETAAGVVHAEILSDGVRLELPRPRGLELDLPLALEGYTFDFLNTGVPHVVAWGSDIAAIDLGVEGAWVRSHARFAPDGTNVNFAVCEKDGSVSVRTFERGVEAETLACGTGATAVAVLVVRRGWASFPVTVHCAGGYDLIIDSIPRAIRLAGGAVMVFDGEVEYGDRV